MRRLGFRLPLRPLFGSRLRFVGMRMRMEGVRSLSGMTAKFVSPFSCLRSRMPEHVSPVQLYRSLLMRSNVNACHEVHD